MNHSLVDDGDSPERKIKKLKLIAEALMRRVEQATDDGGVAYAQFQWAVNLEDQVKARTRDLAHALDLLNLSNAKLEEANRATEAARRNLSDALEAIEEGFALFDPDDRLVMCNSRFGMHLADVKPALQSGLAFDAYIGLVSRSPFLALSEGESREEWAVNRRRRHEQDHSVFNVEISGDRWVQVSEHRTGDGGTVIIQTDITEALRLERVERDKILDRQAGLIRATLDHINQGLCIFDAEGRLAGFNQRLNALLALPLAHLRAGLPFEYILGRIAQTAEFEEGMTGADLGAWVTARGPRSPLRFELRRHEGTILDVFAKEMPDRGFVMSFTDVTAEREAMAALSQANETLEARVRERTLDLEDALARAERASASRSRFVAAASHDLLQPLSAAKLFLSSIEAGGLAERHRSALTKADNALASVEAILDALLDISRLESGSAGISTGPFAISGLLQRLKDEFMPLAVAKGLDLRVVPSSAVIVSDPSCLRRILQNLLSNAIRYTQRGKILVGVRRNAGMARIEVWDTGMGIPEEEQENVFKEFHRVHPSASASAGLGLGLAIVERACAVLNHSLTLASEPGKGTVFKVLANFADERDLQPASEAPTATVPDEPAGGSRIVFLIENDENLRQALVLLLETWGYMALDAASGEEAMALLDEVDIMPDVFLVDHQLGKGMSGLDFIREIRKRHDAVAAAIITADRTKALMRECAAEAVPVMHKPLSPEALEIVLQEMCASGADPTSASA
jgi:signal transduction histidine kinase